MWSSVDPGRIVPVPRVGATRPHDARLIREHDGLDAVADSELAEDVRNVALDGLLAQDELGRNLGVAETAREELEDLSFPFRKPTENSQLRGIASWRSELLDYPPGDRRREQCATGGDGA